jgi:hypothetical protein
MMGLSALHQEERQHKKKKKQEKVRKIQQH